MYVPAGFDALLLFDGFPVLQHLACAVHFDLAKDVWMTTNQLGADVLEDIAEIKIALLVRNLGVQVDLEQQVAQFLGQLLHVVLFQCLDRKSTRLNSSHPSISYAVFCLKKK